MTELNILKKICEIIEGNLCNIDYLLEELIKDESIEVSSINEFPEYNPLLKHKILSNYESLTIINAPNRIGGKTGALGLYIRINPLDQTPECYYIEEKSEKKD